jgi:hypothetical protein
MKIIEAVPSNPIAIQRATSASSPIALSPC